MFIATTQLMAHQETAVAKLLPSRVGAAFMEMGTGKTRTAIELARLRQDKWDKLIWFCPVSIKQTILRQWLEHTNMPRTAFAVWGENERSDALPDARVHIIGIESMSSSDRTVMAYAALITKDSFVVVDESTYIKGPRSRRSQRIIAMSRESRYRLVLTGTPLSQGIVDLYAQMTFLSPRILGYTTFHRFARCHLEYGKVRLPDGRERWTGRIVRTYNEDWLAAKIAPYVYQVRKSECLDLPDKIYETRWFAMSTQQRALYERAKQKILLEIDYEDWSPVRIFHLFSALQSITCGFWTDDGKKQEVPHDRVETLMAVLGEIAEDEPVVVWCKYRLAIDQIAAAVRQRWGEAAVAMFHGGNADQREQQLLRWRAWRDTGTRVLLATQGAGGHGLDLVEARHVIFYADNFKYSERLQAEDRNHRIGQTRPTTYVSLCCSPSIDDRIAAALARKADVLALFQRQVDECRKKGLKDRAIELVRSL